MQYVSRHRQSKSKEAMRKQYRNSDLSALIDEYIHSERDRIIIKDRFINGLTFNELSEKHYLSERQIKRIVAKADKILIQIERE